MKYFLFASALVFLAFSCDDDETVIPNEEEVITELTYTLTSPDHTATFTFSDPDGEGGNDATITGATLRPNTTYTGSLDLGEITAEIQEEDAEHQFFFEFDGALGITATYTDTDDDGNPVGLATSVVTTDANPEVNNGLVLTLRHEPTKTASGVSISNPDAAGGETDIEVIFPVTVE